MSELPIIDLSNFEERKHDIVRDISNACKNVGFFYVVNHGIPVEVVQNMFKDSKDFFNLPVEVKESMAWSTNNAGYVTMNREKLEKEIIDVKESFNVTLSNNWSDNKWFNYKEPLGIKENSSKYVDYCLEVAKKILTAYALVLGLDEDFFTESHTNLEAENSGTTLRFLHYPPMSTNRPSTDLKITRAGAHSDYGSITLLFQDQVGGLEVVSKKGNWEEVKPVENSIDLMQRWTDDVFCSTVHRVTSSLSNSETDRYSIAFFLHPWDSSKYEAISAGDYLVQKVNSTYM